jgi:uncharacterized protein
MAEQQGTDNRRVQGILNTLEEWFAGCESCVVAYSGGIDSALVAYLARMYLGRDRCTAAIGDSSSLKRKDLQEAQDFAAAHDIPLEVVPTCEMDDETYRQNPEDRCFHCKSELFSRLEGVRRRLGFAHILGGENADDQGDYRPGLQAVANHGVRGPLAECGVTKDELRAVARHLGLEIWDKPASPCLSSRIPYFQEITPAKLERVEKGEAALARRGFPVSRVRHHEGFARIEVPDFQVSRLQDMADELAAEFVEIGFPRIEIDPEGFVSGKLNREL